MWWHDGGGIGRDDDNQRRKGVDGEEGATRGGGAGGQEALARQEVTQQPARQKAQEGHDKRLQRNKRQRRWCTGGVGVREAI